MRKGGGGRPFNSVVRLHMIGDAVAAIALDMDGVLLKSNDAKARAMLELFQEYPAKTNEISQFVLRNGGVPRAEKLTHILESIVGIPAPKAVLTEYLAKYEASLEGVLSAASTVPGVEEFLSRCKCPLYLCSSVPPEEVSRQLGGRNLLGYFAETFDCRTPKAVALKFIANRHRKEGVVFFGDSLGDLSAAQSAQVPFVAVVSEWDNFPNHEVVKLHDFADRRAIQRCISEATAAYAI
jgi:phosphoglycolate phosphatase-like HAD superfamily hydrolase